MRKTNPFTPRRPGLYSGRVFLSWGSIMRYWIAAAWALLISSVALAADFPPVDQLPSRPDFPDPLVMFNGEKIATKEQWFQRRRPELKELFQHYMYGNFPP